MIQFQTSGTREMRKWPRGKVKKKSVLMLDSFEYPAVAQIGASVGPVFNAV